VVTQEPPEKQAKAFKIPMATSASLANTVAQTRVISEQKLDV